MRLWANSANHWPTLWSDKNDIRTKMSIAPAPGVAINGALNRRSPLASPALRTSITSEAYNRTTSLSALLVCLLRVSICIFPEAAIDLIYKCAICPLATWRQVSGRGYLRERSHTVSTPVCTLVHHWSGNICRFAVNMTDRHGIFLIK